MNRETPSVDVLREIEKLVQREARRRALVRFGDCCGGQKAASGFIGIGDSAFSRASHGLHMSDDEWRQWCERAESAMNHDGERRGPSKGLIALENEELSSLGFTHLNHVFAQGAGDDQRYPTSTAGVTALRQARAGELLKRAMADESAGLPADLATRDRWIQATWILNRRLQDFVDAATSQVPHILTVVGPAVEGGDIDATKPILMAAAGRVLKPPDGDNADQLTPFIAGDPPTFRLPLPHIPPAFERPRVRGGLILWASHGDVGEGIGGGRVSSLEFSNGLGDYSTAAVSEIRRSILRHLYSEFSKDAQTVQLFRVVGRDPNARLVVAVDLLDECVLDAQACAYVMEAMDNALGCAVGVSS